MSRSSNSETLILSYLFGITLGLTIVVWMLRGFGVLTFLPGGVIWVLIFLSIVTGILSRAFNSRRRY
ncbi:MAG: hypothetical protein N3E45_07810 [Oscillatoriaceae bacterium SKW80]|nr:hypothetical protein [Oscillatoriaceae bacterium SKYG93]MCX8120723.1 hypothetical protein [Oscillatoriaceae bacterium SKW80]MDW8453739.1 hypothetical protein [Oscillatoriaceae cyanobacterium SKYGB_i_bin93]HIK26970.1 hypothetical protein [Oscillatoriaceae cyanobacterium M7585_C2015_266]